MLVLALLAVTVASGCPFTPRETPPPCDPLTDPDCRVIRPPQAPLSPEAVLANIKSGIEQKVVDPHIKDSLDDTFRYLPDLDANNGRYGANYFDGWNKAREVRFMQRVLESGTRPDSVTFFVPGFVLQPDLTGDQARYLIDYKWTLVFHDSTQVSGKRRDVYRFQAFWDFVGLSSNNVRLQVWTDRQLPQPPDPRSIGSSGILRGWSGS